MSYESKEIKRKNVKEKHSRIFVLFEYFYLKKKWKNFPPLVKISERGMKIENKYINGIFYTN